MAQPLGLHHPDPVRHRSQPPVHLRRTRRREGEGVLGDPAGPPPHQLTTGHPCPQQRQPVADLQDLPDVPAAGLGGHPQRCRELDDRELRHERRTGTRQRQAGVPAVLHDRGGIGLGHFMVGAPVHDQLDLPDLLGDLALTGRAHGLQQGGVPAGTGLVRGRCHDPHSTRDHPHRTVARDHLWRGISKPLPVDGSRPTTPMVEPDSHLPRSRQRSLALAARPTIPTLAARPTIPTLAARPRIPVVEEGALAPVSKPRHHRQEGPGQFLSGCGVGRPGCSPPRLSR